MSEAEAREFMLDLCSRCRIVAAEDPVYLKLVEDAQNWRTLMSEAAEHLKEPEHLARVAKVEAAIAHEAEELRLLREWEAERIAAGEVSALPAWQALRAFRERGR